MPYELNQTIPLITIDTKYIVVERWPFLKLLVIFASEYHQSITTLRHFLINKVPFGVGFSPEKIEKVRALPQKERFA